MSTICYLLSDTARLLRREFDARVRQLGVTGPQARLLLLLETSEGENQGFYAERLEVEAISLGRMLDRMGDAGLIERRTDPSDRRAWRIHLTARSRALIGQLRGCIEALDAVLLAGFAPAERGDFSALLAKMRGNIDAGISAVAEPSAQLRTAAHG